MKETPHDVFRETLAVTGDRIAAIRTIRERFGLDMKQAKEVMLQAEGTASSLDEHLQAFVPIAEQLVTQRNPLGAKWAEDDVIEAILVDDSAIPYADVASDAIQANARRASHAPGTERDDRDWGQRQRRSHPEAQSGVGLWIGIGVAGFVFVLVVLGAVGFVFFRSQARPVVAPPQVVIEVAKHDDPMIGFLPPKQAEDIPRGALAAIALPENSGDVVALAYSDDGKMLTVATGRERVFWYDAVSRKLITQSVPRPRDVHGHQFSGAAISPTGDRIAFHGHGGLLYLVDRNFLGMDLIINPVGGGGTAQWKAAFSPDGKRLCTTHGDRMARVWSVQKRELEFSLGGFDQQVGSTAYSADGSMLACADDDILIFDSKTEALRTTIKGPQPFFFHAMTFSPDGKAIAGMHDRTVHVFGLRKADDKLEADAKAKLAHHRGRPTAMAYSPDGTLLLTTSDEGMVHLWNGKTLEPRGEKVGLRAPSALAFRSANGQLAVGAGDRVVLYEWEALKD